MQRFFSSTTMPATDWRAPLCSDEPAATLWSPSCVEDAELVRIWCVDASPAGSGLKNRCLFAGDAPSQRASDREARPGGRR
jgi:hypothetical protein